MWECWECLNSWGFLPFTNGIQTWGTESERRENRGNYQGSSRPMAACYWRMCRSKWAANCAASAHWTAGGRQNSGEFLVGELQMGRFGWAAVIFWSEMLQPWQPCINVGEICMDNAISEKRSLETCRASLHTPDLAEWRPWLSWLDFMQRAVKKLATFVHVHTAMWEAQEILLFTGVLTDCPANGV